MTDPTTVRPDLTGLVESLRGTTVSVRIWARQAKEDGDPEVRAVARQLDRAAQFLDQAIRALRTAPPAEEPARATGIPGMTGSTHAIPLSSLVSFLAEVHASGVLRIYAADENYVLQFENGYLIYAFGDNPPEGMRLGEVLVALGSIARADLLRVLERGWGPNETLGGRLLDEGYVQPEELLTALEQQIQELGRRLFSREDARFRFYPGEQVIARQDVRMNVMGLLLETARLRDEEQRGCMDAWTPPEIDLDLDVA